MDKVREKACRLLNDVKLGKQAEHGVVNVKESNLPGNLESYCTCCYCPKVFINSKYLIKHIFRRHTDNLLSLHGKIIGISKSAAGDEHVSTQSINKNINEHFDIIKKELESVKQHVANNTCQKSCGELKQTLHESSSAKNIEVVENVKLVSDEPITTITKCKEYDELKTKMFEIEGFVKSLCTQVEELRIVVKDDMLFKQEIQKKISHDEKKNLQNQKTDALKLKQVLMSDLQAMFLEKFDEEISWQEKYPDLKNEMDKLHHIMQSVYQQINSPDMYKQFESNLEKKLCWLIENSKASHNSKMIPKYLKKHSKSLTAEGNESVSPETCKSGDQVNDVHHSGTDIVREKYLDVNFLLEQKLQNLNILPNANRVPTATYEKKKKLLSTERDLQCKKNKKFMEVYNNINSYAHHETLAKMRIQKSRKITFSGPVKSRYKTHQINLKSPKVKAYKCKKQESTGFIAADVGTCGDFNFSSIPVNEDNASVLSDSIDECSNRRGSNNQDLRIDSSDAPASSNISLPNLDKDFDELSLQSLSSLTDEEIRRSPSLYFKPVLNTV